MKLLICASSSNVGLFDTVTGSISNLRLENVDINVQGTNVGGIVGIIKSDAVINMDGSKNRGNVSGYAYVGGIAGAISS